MTAGYAGGTEPYPSYNDIKGYAEAIRVLYNPTLITYDILLQHYIEQLGPPIYSDYSLSSQQYRNILLYHNSDQQQSAQALFSKLQQEYSNEEICLSIQPATDFYKAEEFHIKFIEKQLKRDESLGKGQRFSGTGL